MSIIVPHVVRVADKIPSQDIVDISVAIVVLVLPALFLTPVDPWIARQIGMGDIDAGIDDGDDRLGGAGGLLPPGRRADIGARRAIIPQRPLRGELRLG